MGQKKLIRFEELKGFSNVLEYPQNMPGNWHKHFANKNPLVLELACGKGEYAVGLGRMYPHKNFIGIDVKGNRLWKGAKTARQEGLTNVAFLRTQIDAIETYFAKSEVEEIWITFPDPQLRISKVKKRLTHPKFLRKYQQFLIPGGVVNLKTDSPDLYNFTKLVIKLHDLELLKDIDNVSTNGGQIPELAIKTHYEQLDIAGHNRVHYLQFRLNGELLKDKDDQLKEIVRETAVEGRS